MAEHNLTHAEFTAKLVAEGCLPIARGKLPASMPIQAVPLTAEEREKAGAHPRALAVFYPVGDTGVFMQMRDAHARVWYAGVDCDGAVETLELALHRVHPDATFVAQEVHPNGPDINVRLYRVPVDAKHFIDVEVTYPIDRRARQQFVVRLHGRERI